ncbi:MAG: hypothetical protein DRN71_03325 [Candidatus Nanohalarchaeota archaeon]|nr:MAG: hypothetical protein DRN71_03325 [Candidatus Nanohaloarchaeota archaeon]
MIPNKTLKEIVITTKRGLSSYYLQKEGAEVSFINIRDVQNSRINAATVETVSVKETGALDKSRIQAKDIIITIKGTALKAALADETVKGFVLSANLIAFKLSDEVLPEIVVGYLNSPKGQKELQSRSAGAVQKALNLKSLMDIKIPVPDKKKQMSLAKYFLLSKKYDELTIREQELRKKINNKMIEKHMH